MAAVASVVGTSRHIWTNDIQHFAHECSKAHFCSASEPPSRSDTAALISGLYSDHTQTHLAIASSRVNKEEKYVANKDFDNLAATYEDWTKSSQLEKRTGLKGQDATLFRDTFAGSYFGLSQSIEIDAIRYAIDQNRLQSKIDDDQHRWLVLALCVAVSKCSTSTGHFAQPVRVKASNIRWFTAQRRRSIRETFMNAVDQLCTFGDKPWRRQNRAMRAEANDCLASIEREKAAKPAVIYADPPYTDDQYSRYYHLYETLIRYDYPEAIGHGRYRRDREISSFSLRASVFQAFTTLVERCAALEADLVLSYPTNGLLSDSRNTIPEIIRRVYGKSPNAKEICHLHSTMGGSKGEGKRKVTEVIYKVRQ